MKSDKRVRHGRRSWHTTENLKFIILFLLLYCYITSGPGGRICSIYTVGAKSMSPDDIKLLLGNLCNITALHHNTNIFCIEIK